MRDRVAGVSWRHFRWGRSALILGLGLVLLSGAACTTSGLPPAPEAEPATPTPTPEPSATREPVPAPEPLRVVVDIQDFAFIPQEITVPTGSLVIWVMRDRGTTHTVTIEDPVSGEQFDERLETGESFQYRFEKAGVFAYYCRIHPDTPAMRATVRIEAPG